MGILLQLFHYRSMCRTKDRLHQFVLDLSIDARLTSKTYKKMHVSEIINNNEIRKITSLCTLSYQTDSDNL